MGRFNQMGFLFLIFLGLLKGNYLLVDPNTYRLGPGDGVEILVEGRTYFSYMTYVDPQGLIDIYVMGPGAEALKLKETEEIPSFSINKVAFIEVGGKTIREAEKLIEEKIGNYFSDAKVSLRLVEARIIQVPVTGAVIYPGIYPATPLDRVSTLISKAGGFKPGASLSRIEIKGPEETREVNLFEFFIKGNLEENPFIEEGISIFVPQAEEVVRVKGAILGLINRIEATKAESEMEKASTVAISPVNEVVCEFREGDTVYDVLYKAGGPSPLADMENIVIQRGDSLIKDVTLSTPVRPGDVILIPVLPNSVYVEGEVSNPGAFHYNPGMTVLDYIGMAGGFTERASRKNIYVVKRNGERKRVSLTDTLDRGDKIVVKGVVLKWWEDYLQILSVATTLVVTWLTVTR
jgi:protein involved in polysaccharide export with SLBB domain